MGQIVIVILGMTLCSVPTFVPDGKHGITNIFSSRLGIYFCAGVSLL